MKEHNTNFYSLENIKKTLESCKDFLDGEEVYYHIGALRYAYEEIERLNNIIEELEIYLLNHISKREPEKETLGECIVYKTLSLTLEKLQELKQEN